MKRHVFIVILQLAVSGADAYFTNADQRQVLHHEQNPIARQFVGSTAGIVTYFSAQTAIKLTLPAWLRKHNHRRIAELAEIAGIADNATCATNSALHQHSLREKAK